MYNDRVLVDLCAQHGLDLFVTPDLRQHSPVRRLQHEAVSRVLDELQPPVAIHRVGNVDEQWLRDGEPRVSFQHVHDLFRVVPGGAGVPQR